MIDIMIRWHASDVAITFNLIRYSCMSKSIEQLSGLLLIYVPHWRCYIQGPDFIQIYRFNWYGKYHFGHRTVSRSSFLHKGFSYTGKKAFIYNISAQIAVTHFGCFSDIWDYGTLHIFLMQNSMTYCMKEAHDFRCYYWGCDIIVAGSTWLIHLGMPVFVSPEVRNQTVTPVAKWSRA